MKTKKEEGDDEPVDLQIQLESLRTEHELLKHAFDDLDQDYKAISKENERLKKQVRPPSKPESKFEPKAGPGEPGIVGKLQQDKAELVAFLQLFRNRNEFKQALFELANAKEFYWLLDKHNKPEPIIIE